MLGQSFSPNVGSGANANRRQIAANTSAASAAANACTKQKRGQLGALDDSLPTTALGGESIVIQRQKVIDGSLGFWRLMGKVFPLTKNQTTGSRDRVPVGEAAQEPAPKAMLYDIWVSATREDVEAFDRLPAAEELMTQRITSHYSRAEEDDDRVVPVLQPRSGTSFLT